MWLLIYVAGGQALPANWAKHVARIAGVDNCVAYGPGILELAHQPDEWCGVDDLINATKVLALSTMELAGVE